MPLIEKPPLYPLWAESNPLDPISGQPAISEPSTGKKNSGFLSGEEVVREDFNWLFNLNNQWQEWTDALQLELMTDKISGFRLLKYENTSPNFGVYVGQGRCLDIAKSKIMSSTFNGISSGTTPGGASWPVAGVHKRLSGISYVKGTGNCGRAPTVSLTDVTWYHVFVIYFSDTKTLDIGFDTDVVGTNLLTISGAANVRRIFSIFYTTANDLIEHIQIGNYFLKKDFYNLSGISLTPGTTTSDINVSNHVPKDISSILLLKGEFKFDNLVGSQRQVRIRPEFTPAAIGGSVVTARAPGITASDYLPFGTHMILIDGTLSPPKFVIENAGTALASTEAITLDGEAEGYIDLRGLDWGQGVTGAENQGNYF